MIARDAGYRYDPTAMSDYYVHPSAELGDDVSIGAGSSIWHLVQIREGARIGAECVIGRGAYVGAGVTVGDRTKIQNYALLYEPARIGQGVFIGPGVVLTNDAYPRAVDPDMSVKHAGDWEAAGVTVGEGASIGARSVVLAGVSIGRWALVGAGSVVIRDVPAYGLVVGNPALRRAWVGRTGRRLVRRGQWLECPDTGDRFVETDGAVQPAS